MHRSCCSGSGACGQALMPPAAQVVLHCLRLALEPPPHGCVLGLLKPPTPEPLRLRRPVFTAALGAAPSVAYWHLAMMQTHTLHNQAVCMRMSGAQVGRPGLPPRCLRSRRPAHRRCAAAARAGFSGLLDLFIDRGSVTSLLPSWLPLLLQGAAGPKDSTRLLSDGPLAPRRCSRLLAQISRRSGSCADGVQAARRAGAQRAQHTEPDFPGGVQGN